MKKLLLLFTTILILSCSKKEQPIINETPVIQESKTVQIGNQLWTKRNLDVSTYRNGDTIPQVTDPTEWVNLTTGAWCYYNNDPEMGKIYGKLYNWYAVNDSRGLAPDGYRIPSDSDYSILINYLGGDSIAGGKIKESGLSHWLVHNNVGTDDFGFTALPGGNRVDNGDFGGIGIIANWWNCTYFLPNACSPEGSGGFARLYGEVWAYSDPRKLYLEQTILFYGCSVRCIKN
jgi:uncharacterized protein (TIGR02145 family)